MRRDFKSFASFEEAALQSIQTQENSGSNEMAKEVPLCFEF